LAHANNLEPDFMDWLEDHNEFCNSLVDRIVPGKPDTTETLKIENKIGYQDNLLTITEAYRLWAIEGNEKIASILSFSQVDEGIIVTPNIQLYRELKLHILNGTHTLSCALALLCGFKTVKQAMGNKPFEEFIIQLIHKEIIPSIPYSGSLNDAHDFAGKVLDRFRNPFIEHLWMNISTQYTSKMKMRVLPVLLQHYSVFTSVPKNITLGFAAYIRFMKVTKNDDGQFLGEINGNNYAVNDTYAERFNEIWKTNDPIIIVKSILKDIDLWATDLTELPGFEIAVFENLVGIMKTNILEINNYISNKPIYSE
jgi:tagaturonate reductase